MRITREMRWAGAAAMVGGLIAIVMTPAFATAYFLAFPGEDAVPFWFDALEDRLGSLLTFASPDDVYETYGRSYNIVYLLFMPMVVALHRAHGPPEGSLARRGYVVLTAGLAATTVGVAGDYWGNGAGFPLEALGLIAMVVGVAMWGVGAVRSEVIPRLWCWLLLSCGPGAVATSAVVGHIPSGPTLSFALVWVVVGALLLSHRNTKVAVGT